MRRLGAALGIETASGAVLAGLAGGLVGGTLGYLGMDVSIEAFESIPGPSAVYDIAAPLIARQLGRYPQPPPCGEPAACVDVGPGVAMVGAGH